MCCCWLFLLLFGRALFTLFLILFFFFFINCFFFVYIAKIFTYFFKCFFSSFFFEMLLSWDTANKENYSLRMFVCVWECVHQSVLDDCQCAGFCSQFKWYSFLLLLCVGEKFAMYLSSAHVYWISVVACLLLNRFHLHP